ncbi:MAG: hypothetical protein MH321_08055 [Leptospiraceae bacterium]|nr:hypothetical protein [Leptospiraceae bacterium]
MDLIELKNRIIKSYTGPASELSKILKSLEGDQSIFPFNEYEHLISTLIENKGISFHKYLEIRSEYISCNPHLWIFEISAPRGFGEKFAQTYVLGKSRNLAIPNKKLDKNFSGDYDLWLDGIKIEVKASRAVDSDSDEPLYMRALSRGSKKNFLMNFQQLKPQCCDVFIWVAVFRDEIVLWVLNSKEVSSNAFYSKGQHRGNIGNEGQLHITNENIHILNKFEYKNGTLDNSIKKAYKRL